MTPSAILLFCFVSIFVDVNGAKLPSYIKACKVRSPDFRKCAVESGKAAIPTLINGDQSLGFPKLNPLYVPFIEFASGDLKLNATDLYIHGLSGIILNDVSVDLSKKVITLNGTLPEGILDMNYNVGGKLASLPIQGNGKGKINFYGTLLIYTFDFEEYEMDGQKHFKIKKDKFDVFPEKLSIQLDNLFNGNKLLGENTNKLLNENWPEVLTEFRPALTEILGIIVRGLINPLAKKIPLNKIFPDY